MSSAEMTCETVNLPAIKRQLEPSTFLTFADHEIISHESASPFSTTTFENTYKVYQPFIIDAA